MGAISPAPGAAVDGAADTLRDRILAGRLRPGDRLSEVALGAELGVSRNTLREAFRLLAHDRLVEHRPNRGVFVRRPTVREAREVYAARRLLECGALREAAVLARPLDVGRVQAVQASGRRGLAARDRGDWEGVGTANGEFHLALVALGDNAVIEQMVRALVIEIRLLFVALEYARDVHEPYVEDNLRIANLVDAGELGRAAVALEEYLLRAERHLLTRYAEVIDRDA